MRQACVRFNVFQSNDNLQNRREDLYTKRVDMHAKDLTHRSGWHILEVGRDGGIQYFQDLSRHKKNRK